MLTYYNEIEKYPVKWLHNLMIDGKIGMGIIDPDSIANIETSYIDSLKSIGYNRMHFFAGIAGWDLALQLAKFPEDIEVWTGSCPCQPFSQAGKRLGVKDARHLWPEWYKLIEHGRPKIIFGEQVSGKDGRTWLNGVRTDLEALGYGFFAADLCSAGVNSPNLRQRLYWAAFLPEMVSEWQQRRNRDIRERDGGGADALANPNEIRREGREPNATESRGEEANSLSESCGKSSWLDNSSIKGLSDWTGKENTTEKAWVKSERPSDANFWSDYDTVWCRDGKIRRIEPGTFPLVARVPKRVGALKAYGNAINPWVAKVFIETIMEIINE